MIFHSSFTSQSLETGFLNSAKKACTDEQDILKNAERICISMVGSRWVSPEKLGKSYKAASDMLGSRDSILTESNQNDIGILVERDFRMAKLAWKQVEAASKLESVQLVFIVLVKICAQLRQSGTDVSKYQLLKCQRFQL